MNKFLVILFLVVTLTLPVWGQQALQVVAFSSTTSGKRVYLIGTGINWHDMTWNVLGTVTTCTVKIEQSVDAVSWSDFENDTVYTF